MIIIFIWNQPPNQSFNNMEEPLINNNNLIEKEFDDFEIEKLLKTRKTLQGNCQIVFNKINKYITDNENYDKDKRLNQALSNKKYNYKKFRRRNKKKKSRK